MKYQGLVDPEDKPFCRVLPFEVQVKIMFWVECFVTMDKRKTLLREFKGLPKYDVTGLPQHLGQDQWWNQVMVRFHVPRISHCHHCHRMFDHRLSVSEDRYVMAEMARSPVILDNLMNEGIAFATDRFQVSLADCPIGMRPVMIGRRKPAYNTIGKVMGRLNRVMMVLETMRHIAVVNVHWEFY